MPPAATSRARTANTALMSEAARGRTTVAPRSSSRVLSSAAGMSGSTRASAARIAPGATGPADVSSTKAMRRLGCAPQGT